VREGPDYKRNGRKSPSLPHVYQVVAGDIFRRPKILYDVASVVTLPPVPDPAEVNDTGLPRRFVLNVIIPAEAPPLISAKTDDACYQVVLYFTATTAALREWVRGGSPASRLFARWVREGLSDAEVKERFKLLVRMENLKEAGLTWLQKYNGKPALITKSGRMSVGDDFVEMSMNTFFFAYITKKGISSILPRVKDLKLHCAVTIEGRDNDELPEQALAAGRIPGLDLQRLATPLHF